MTRDERRKMIRELKSKNIDAEYEVITDDRVSALHYVHIIQPQIQRDLNKFSKDRKIELIKRIYDDCNSLKLDYVSKANLMSDIVELREILVKE